MKIYRDENEVIGGTAPGHDLIVKDVRATVAHYGWRCLHVTEFGTCCDSCLDNVAVDMVLFPDRLR
jgi:hypothetical protein